MIFHRCRSRDTIASVLHRRDGPTERLSRLPGATQPARGRASRGHTAWPGACASRPLRPPWAGRAPGCAAALQPVFQSLAGRTERTSKFHAQVPQPGTSRLRGPPAPVLCPHEHPRKAGRSPRGPSVGAWGVLSGKQQRPMSYRARKQRHLHSHEQGTLSLCHSAGTQQIPATRQLPPGSSSQQPALLPYSCWPRELGRGRAEPTSSRVTGGLRGAAHLKQKVGSVS